MVKYALILLVVWLAIFVNNPLCASSVVCRDESGNPVDWFVLYKIPKLENDPSSLLRSGFSYAYITGPSITVGRSWLSNPLKAAKKPSSSWKLSSQLITKTSSLLGQTISVAYSKANQPKSSNSTYIFYNDAPPSDSGKESSNYAHAKGVLVADGKTGFWLVHSIPNFGHSPNVTESYSYPDSGKDNGQTAICISFDTTSQLDSIINQFLTMRPNVYAINISPDVAAISTKIAQLKAKKWPRGQDDSVSTISTIRGEVFTSFVRNSGSKKKDLYVDMIAPAMESDLLVETWRRGSGTPLPSNCTYKYHVNNVKSVELTFEGGSISRTQPWSFLEDHSKWAVGSDKQVACVGDINRMASQYKRGGGSLCSSDPAIWNVLKESINEIEGCPRRNGRLSASSSTKSTSYVPYSMAIGLISSALATLSRH